MSRNSIQGQDFQIPFLHNSDCIQAPPAGLSCLIRNATACPTNPTRSSLTKSRQIHDFVYHRGGLFCKHLRRLRMNATRVPRAAIADDLLDAVDEQGLTTARRAKFQTLLAQGRTRRNLRGFLG